MRYNGHKFLLNHIINTDIIEINWTGFVVLCVKANIIAQNDHKKRIIEVTTTLSEWEKIIKSKHFNYLVRCSPIQCNIASIENRQHAWVQPDDIIGEVTQTNIRRIRWG